MASTVKNSKDRLRKGNRHRRGLGSNPVNFVQAFFAQLLKYVILFGLVGLVVAGLVSTHFSFFPAMKGTVLML